MRSGWRAVALRLRSSSPGASSSLMLTPSMRKALRGLGIGILRPVGGEIDNANAGLRHIGDRGGRGVKPLADGEEALHLGPAAAAHEGVDRRQALALQDHRLGRPLSGALAHDRARDLILARVERERVAALGGAADHRSTHAYPV